MPIDLECVGRKTDYRASWTSTEALLYALGVGAGTTEPAFTTENSESVEQRVLPTFAVVIGSGLHRMPDFGIVDMSKLVHGEQRVTIHRPIPVEGEVDIQRRIVGIYDKVKAAVVATESVAVDTRDREPLYSTYTSSFIVGEGGWGGDRGTSERSNEAPAADADVEITYQTRPDQALLYRLNGDRNRLHSDPAFAAAGGFPQPILHGLCTYGFTARALLHGLCDSDPTRFAHIEGRFSATVVPGDSLTIRMWRTAPGVAVFHTRTR